MNEEKLKNPAEVLHRNRDSGYDFNGMCRTADSLSGAGIRGREAECGDNAVSLLRFYQADCR